jgi:multidrug efflux system outer membrane protein
MFSADALWLLFNAMVQKSCRKGKKTMSRPLHFFLLGSTCFLMSGCAALPQWRDYTPPAEPKLSKDVLQENEKGRFKLATPVQQWWDTLGDPDLSALIKQSLTHNYDMRIALANVEKARANLGATQYDRFPTVTANGNSTHEYLSEESSRPEPTDRSINSYQAGFDAAWELDLFGRISQGITEQEALYEANRASLQDSYVTVAAEVARVYTELRGAQYRLDVATRNTTNQKKTYDLISNLAKGGRSNDLDIARAQSQLDFTRASIPPLEAEVNAAINRLGVLTGQSPDALRSALKPRKSIPSIPATIAVGDAQGLLKYRPDIRAAERNLAASVAAYNVNVTDLYPRISLQGSFGFLARTGANLFTGGAATALLAPTIDWAAFDLGRRLAFVDAADAETQIRLATFDKTVMGALEELDTAMVNFSREEERRARLLSSAKASARAANLARQRYEAGKDSFLDLLDAESRLLEAEDQLAVSETQAVVKLIAVYKALGGGWKLSPAP